MNTTNLSDLHFASVEKPWMKHYGEYSLGKHVPHRTMYRLIIESCERNKRHEACAFEYFGKKTTYRSMHAMVDQYAAAFVSLGVKRGDIVTMVSVCMPETICELYALNKIGAVCAIVDPRTDAPHIREYIQKAKSRVVVTLEMNYGAIDGKLDELGIDYVVVQTPAGGLPKLKALLYKLKSEKYAVPYDNKRIIRDAAFFRRGAGKSVEEVPYEPDMPAVVLRTGGTTGTSKGVVLTNDNINAVAANFFITIPTSEIGPFSNQTFLNFLPLASSYGLAVGVHMTMCMTMVDYIIPKFNPDEFDKLVLKYKPRHIIGVPVFYEKLIYSPLVKGADLSFIDTMAAGGDSASETLEDKLDEFRLKHGIKYPVAQGYGMSELGSAAAFGFRDVHRKGSAGIPCFFSLIAAFEPGTTRELPIGEIGELCITGQAVMKEYLDEPEETANVLWEHPDGNIWVHSGDLGYIDEDGFLFIVGRIKRTIIRPDGHKVYPLQIEKVVMKHPQVANCSVISVKDRNNGQGEQPLICAELVQDTGEQAKITAEILKLCREELEERGQPVGVVYVEEIPITNMAKNDYRKLTELYGDFDYRTLN